MICTDHQTRNSVPLIRVENLHYRYPPFDPNDPDPDMSWALDGVSLDVAAGEFLGIVGTTGSGKSTLCLALTGLVPQQTSGTIRGDVWVGDINTKRRPVVEIAERVGIVFQEPESNFLGLTVEDEVAFGLENLAFAKSEIEERIDWALELTGVDRLRERAVSQLSGGQKQRVAIASVIAMLPDVLVLDDPTAELDPAGTDEVLTVLASVRDRRPETAIVMTSGDPAPLVEGADRILALDAGREVLSGSPSELIDAAGELLDLGIAVPVFAELAVRLQRECGAQLRFSDPANAAIQLRHFLAR